MWINLSNLQNKRIDKIQDFIFKNLSPYKLFKSIQRWDPETLEYINEHKKPDMSQLQHMLYGRNEEQYLDNLVMGWLIEDFARIKLDAKQNNKDQDRRFVKDKDAANNLTEMDLSLGGNKIEIVLDVTGYTTKNKSVTLNRQKYDRIIRNNAFLLIVNIEDNCFILTNLKRETVKDIKQFGTKKIYKKEVTLANCEIYDIELFTKEFVLNIIHNQ